jgi:hypothetical protein
MAATGGDMRPRGEARGEKNAERAPASTAARFASGVAVAATTTFVGLNHLKGAVTTDAAGPTQAADAKIRITPNLTPGAATGVLHLSVWTITGVPPSA